MPAPFTTALASLARRTIIPADLSSREWNAVAPQIRARAFFSARVTIAELLQKLKNTVATILNPQPGERLHVPEVPGAPSVPVTEGIDQATARLAIKDYLRSTGYAPEPGQYGTLQDLSSDARINLQLRTNVETAQGYGQFAQGQQDDILQAFPCQELFRAEDRKEKRNWPQRWTLAAQIAQDPKALYALTVHGRMIARKDSRIWQELGNLEDDSLGNPYPPFAFQSGMWVRDIGRREAVQLNLIDPGATVARQERTLNDTLEANTADMSWELRDALMADLGPNYQRDSDGVIRRI